MRDEVQVKALKPVLLFAFVIHAHCPTPALPTELEECVGALAYLSGVDLDLATVTDSRGRAPLSIAAGNGQTDLAVALLRDYPTLPINAVDDDGYRYCARCTVL